MAAVSLTQNERRRAEVRQYSTIVWWMKILLPVLAVGLIVLIFLMGRERAAVIDTGLMADTAALAAGLKLDNPRFAGVTDAGDPFIVTAEWALPDGAVPDRIELERPTGELRMGSGTTLNVKARTGEMQRKDEQLHLVGSVEATTSDGYVARAERVEMDLARKTALVPGPITAEGPRGRISADKMRVERATPETRDVIIHFEGNVRVRLIPKGS